MRSLFALLLLTFGLSTQASAQTCTSLGCQVSCPGTATTTISGVVYAPNGMDPLPNVTVYIPTAPVDPFTPGVSCPVAGTPPSGSPLVGTTTGVDGTFQLQNVPVGTNIPVVAVTGRWRRQIVVPSTTMCADTPGIKINMPTTSSEGDIPKFAIATGSVDQVECVLLKVGLKQSEFTNPGGGGRIEIYQGDGNVGKGSGGAIIDSTTPAESTLMGDPTNATLNQYDVLMLPCEGGNYLRAASQLNNLINFANAGGRVYSSHFAYAWMYQNPPFSGVVNWNTANKATLSEGVATVNTGFADGQTLQKWLQLVGATTTPGQMTIETIKHDFNGVVSPTQSYLALNSQLDSDAHPVMQFVFDTPVKQTSGQCGRVLFNEYHVENGSSSNGAVFPNECNLSSPMSPQEKLLEFSLFELTDDGGQATLTPISQDFGTEPVGFTSAPQTFTFTNNSTFSESVTVESTTGDFAITSAPCGAVGPGASCTVTVVFTPTAVGARTGTLTVGAGAQTLTSALTGTGVTDITSTPTSLNFGNVDVGATLSMNITVTSNAPAGIPFPAVVTTGDYSATTTCPSVIPALGTCTITVTFKPTTTGSRPGTLASSSTSGAYAGLTTQLSGNGVDFTISVSPTSGAAEAGYGSSTLATVTPIAGFASSVNLICTTNAAASTCIPTLVSFVPSEAVTTKVPITTTSQYTVIGFTAGSAGLLSLIAIGSGWLLWMKRRSAGNLARCALTLCIMAAAALSFTGCSGKQPAQNSPFTAAGTYTYTLSATDGFLTHTATYSLTVTSK
jgi:hypothetical protein